MIIDLVVSRYNEDLQWLEHVPSGMRVYVYNKGKPVLIPRSAIVTFLPNVGREAHTYLHHIIYEWGNMQPFTVFCQGNPFAPHDPHFITNLASFAATPPYEGKVFHPFGPYFECDRNAGPHHGGLPLAEYWQRFFHWNVAGDEMPERFKFVQGAQFAVDVYSIQRRGLEFYCNAIKQVDKDPGAAVGLDVPGGTWGAHCLERFWRNVFYATDV